MPFFLVGRSRDDASLTLLSTEVFDTRDLAARAVQSIAVSGSIDVEAVDVFIADLGASAPVVLVGLPAAAPIADEAAAGAWEAPDATEASEVVAEVVVEASAEPEAIPQPEPAEPEPELEDVAAAVDSLSAGEALTAALERATSSMAAEGIVPPESVGFAVLSEEASTPPAPILGDDVPLPVIVSEEPVFDEPVVVEPEIPEGDDLSAVIASLSSLDEPVVAEESPAEEVIAEPEPETEDTTWPWLNIGEVADEAVATDDTEEPVATGDTEEAPSDPASVPMDVSLDVEDAAPEVEAELEDEPTAVAESTLVDEPVPVPTAPAEEDSLIAPSVAFGSDEFSPKPVIMGDYADVPAVPEPPTTAYEPSGELSLADYTCTDCIYSNTCPKVNDSTPEECGSFQWKAL